LEETNKGLLLFSSPDGIHWKKMTDKRVITDRALDSLNVAFWDPLREEYVIIYRAHLMGTRKVNWTTSKDFLQWTPGKLADYGDAPLEQLYTNATTPYFRHPRFTSLSPSDTSRGTIPSPTTRATAASRKRSSCPVVMACTGTATLWRLSSV
jgi:hypothetical protein